MGTLNLITTDEFTLKGEFLWFGLVLHCDVHVRWSKGVKERLKQSIQQLTRSVSVPVYAFQTASHDAKKLKFIKEVGGIFHHRRTTGSQEMADMYLFTSLD